jgi:hypothetical protein
MKASLKIKSDRVFYEASSEEMYKQIQKNIVSIQNKVKPQISSIILNELMNSNTVNSLLAGKLKDDFGLFGNVVNVTVNNIVNTISQNIQIQITRSKKAGSILTIAVNLLPQNISELFSVAGGSFPSKGGNVDWLEWLLTRGTQVIIGDYWLFPNAKGFTRSGGTSIMKRIESKPREPFRVDSNYAGSPDDNFITRAIESVADDILDAVAIQLERGF